jgi:hypothetical protein
VTEREFEAAVVDVARLFGWRVAHFRPAQTQKGWRTPVSYDGKGWPDLVLVRERVVYVELKGHGGRVSNEQREWLQALVDAGQEAYCWYPSDWTGGYIEQVLETQGRGARAA